MTGFRLAVHALADLAIAQINEWRPLDQLIVGGVVVLAITYVWSWPSLRGVVVTRRVPSDRAQVGQLVSDQLTVRNRSWLGNLLLEIRDHSTLPDHGVSRVV